MTKPPTPVESLLHRWDAEIGARRARTAQDPIADAIASCAADLKEALASDQRTELTTAEFAFKHCKAEVTVRRWCRLGRIESRPAGRGYLIPANALPPAFPEDGARNIRTY